MLREAETALPETTIQEAGVLRESCHGYRAEAATKKRGGEPNGSSPRRDGA